MLFLLDLNINLLFSTFYTANTLPDCVVRLYHNPAILHLWITQASVASEICLASKEIDLSNRKIFVDDFIDDSHQRTLNLFSLFS